jgi:hypothetical protein
MRSGGSAKRRESKSPTLFIDRNLSIESSEQRVVVGR